VSSHLVLGAQTSSTFLHDTDRKYEPQITQITQSQAATVLNWMLGTLKAFGKRRSLLPFPERSKSHQDADPACAPQTFPLFRVFKIKTTC